MEKQNDSDENIETIMEVNYANNKDLLYSNYDSISETSSQYDNYQYSVDDESLMIVEEDENSTISSNSGELEIDENLIKSKINISKHSMVKNSDENIIVHPPNIQVNINEKTLSSVVFDSSKCSNISTKNNSFIDLEKISMPKKTDITNIKYNIKPSLANQIKKTKSISFISSSVLKPSTTTTARIIKPKPVELENTQSKFLTKSINDLKKAVSNDKKSEVYMVPHDGINYMVRKVNINKDQQTNPNIKSTTLNSNLENFVETSNLKKKLLMSSKSPNKFVAQMQKLPDGKFKVVRAQGKVPVALENLFKRNSDFIKQKIASNSASNLCKVSNYIKMKKTLVNQTDIQRITKSKLYQNQLQVKNIGKIKDPDYMSLDKEENSYTINKNCSLLKEEKTNINAKNNHTSINEEDCSSGFIKISPNSLIQSDEKSSVIIRPDTLSKLNQKQNSSINFVPKIKKEDDNLNDTSAINEEVMGVIEDDSNDNITCLSFKDLKRNHCNSTDNEKNKISPENSNKKLLLNNGIKIEKNDIQGCYDDNHFVSCHYEYCDTLVHKLELIDNLYCSFACKKLDFNKNIEESATVQEAPFSSLPLKPKIDRQQILTKIGNRIIHKRKQLLTPPSPDKRTVNDGWDEPFFDSSCSEPPNDILSSKYSPINNSFHEIDDDDDDDDDDGDIVFDLESVNGDQNLLNYLEEMQMNSAPKSLFDKPFPNEQNPFKVGQKLEGIDPEHEALFCVMTIVQVQGYRIKLHFDGYPGDYDFWVNADCPDIFYTRWCEQNDRTVQPPKNYEKRFDWENYLKECRAMPSPKWGFSSLKKSTNSQIKKFKVGAKLEALDKLTRTLPKQLICVATVADILGDRIRIHFDGWTDDFDYWTDITSTNIHPVKWCDNNGRVLSAPSGYNDYKGKKPFSWTEYLKETNSEPVPEEAFIRRPLRDFSINMTIEVVDLVVPQLIRVAKVIDVKGDEIKILYDGFRSVYAYWVEDDSPDIHPIGWAVRTNHPLEIPPRKNYVNTCGVVGCSGKGNANSLKTDHNFIKDCPYELDTWKKAVAGLAKIPDRLKTEDDINSSINTSTKSHSQINHQDDEIKGKNKNNNLSYTNETSLKQKGKLVQNKQNDLHFKKTSRHNTDSKVINVKQSTTNINDLELRKEVGMSTIAHNMGPLSETHCGRSWTRHNAQLGLPIFGTNDVLRWSVEEVASYVDRFVGTKFIDKYTNEEFNVSDRFLEQEIDGEAFLMLTQDDMMKLMKIPLGPSIKLYSAIIMLRQRTPAFNFEL
ncbi:uncharacterized protein LOC126901179 isoform X2 [Daktulosphaira vitifoliae]|uniref:uncharacterized protein LOC126901179 isoform X2 n=1 Tax=Daktulosphaira vitifoliae TaxID=58002 RepID=UPI0021A98A8E|nr:uncharacterized protein LOC126901179 isoform X2 [Daktulosphaira vitifoliae]